jgi:hypothetical protein
VEQRSARGTESAAAAANGVGPGDYAGAGAAKEGLHRSRAQPSQRAIDGREIVVRAGETLCIPSNMPHKAEALADTVDLDVFCPPRSDWINKTDQYLREKK